MFDHYQEESKQPYPLSKISTLSFENVSFSYGNQTVINHLNFKVNQGDIVLVKGESGQGKTTLFKLLLGLYAPTDGTIFVDDSKEKFKVNESSRHLFSYVPQSQFILSGTIKDNLTFYEDILESKMIEATKKAQIHDDIMKLPNQYQTLLGEKGMGLSEGQIQRIALARAFIKDSPIFILDEVTSAIDKTTEQKILTSLKSMKDKTIFISSHRDITELVIDKTLIIK